MDTIAVVLQQPEQIELHRLALTAPTATDVVVDVEWSGVSTGTERLLWSGRMPQFPGMGYPLVPGYESVGRIVEAGSATELRSGQRVFVPGAKCFGEVRGLFVASCWRLRRRRITRSRRAAPPLRIASSATASLAGCWRASRSRSGTSRPWCGRKIPRVSAARSIMA